MTAEDLCIACVYRLSGGTTRTVIADTVADYMHVGGGLDQSNRDSVLVAASRIKCSLTDSANARSGPVLENTSGAAALTVFGLRYVEINRLDAELAREERTAGALQRVRNLVTNRGWQIGGSSSMQGKGKLTLTKKLSPAKTVTVVLEHETAPTLRDWFDLYQRAESDALT